jgi:hypothetical protein
MKSPHTPGPWLVDFNLDEFDSKQSEIRIIDGSDASMTHPQGPLTIANLNVCAFAPHMDEPIANARLIAAAPELLSALERLAHPMADDEDLDYARAIIAKAKGKA